MLKSIFVILVSTILVNNYVFAQFLGVCPFLGVSAKVDTAIGMGIAVTFVVVLRAPLPGMIKFFIINP